MSGPWIGWQGCVFCWITIHSFRGGGADRGCSWYRWLRATANFLRQESVECSSSGCLSSSSLFKIIFKRLGYALRALVCSHMSSYITDTERIIKATVDPQSCVFCPWVQEQLSWEQTETLCGFEIRPVTLLWSFESTSISLSDCFGADGVFTPEPADVYTTIKGWFSCEAFTAGILARGEVTPPTSSQVTNWLNWI